MKENRKSTSNTLSCLVVNRAKRVGGRANKKIKKEKKKINKSIDVK